jgi:hypothetical protein
MADSQPTDPPPDGIEPFRIKDCALVALATGKKSSQLREFRTTLAGIDLASIYHHFWGGLLQARFEEREYNNDFAAWVRHSVHDVVLAERLAAVDPTAFKDLEELRHELLELIDQRMDEVEYIGWARAAQFEFITSQIVVFDTGRRLQSPSELGAAVPTLSTSSIFYHFIDGRRRSVGGHDDFTEWLTLFGAAYDDLRQRLAGIDPYFGSLSDLKKQLADLFRSHFAETAK